MSIGVAGTVASVFAVYKKFGTLYIKAILKALLVLLKVQQL